MIDPLAGRRLGLVYRRERTVRLHMPSTEELTAELASRQKRATGQYNRARKIRADKSVKKLPAE